MKWLPPPSVPSWLIQVRANWRCIFATPGCFADDAVEAIGERTCRARMRTPAHLVVVVLAEADRNGSLDGAAQPGEAVGQLIGAQRQAHGVHSAADVHAHGRRDDGALGRDHAADGRADAGVHVGHGGDVAVDDRQLRDVDQLLQRFVLDVFGPDVDRHAALVDGLLDWHCGTPLARRRTDRPGRKAKSP